MSGLLEGRAVVVTGAGSGLGREYALACGAAGASVLVNDVDDALCRGTAEAIREAGGTAEPRRAPVGAEGVGDELVTACLERFGRLDGLVNNAGVLSPGVARDQPRAQVVRTFEVNVLGVLDCAAAAMRHMVPAGSGSIVNVVSGAIQGLPGLSLYGATKGAVLAATYGWALELAGTGVRVNAVSPLANTTMSDQMDVADAFKGGPARGVAPVVVALLSPLTEGLTGQVVRFDGSALGLVAPPQLAVTSPAEGWTAELIAQALTGPLGEWTQPGGWPSAGWASPLGARACWCWVSAWPQRPRP